VHGFGLLGVTTFVKYVDSVASDFDDNWRHFGGVEACINASRLSRICLIKNLTPSRVSPVRKKSTGAGNVNAYIEIY
jgi:hypothetical protein